MVKNGCQFVGDLMHSGADMLQKFDYSKRKYYIQVLDAAYMKLVLNTT
jgi:hypothetical protein